MHLRLDTCDVNQLKRATGVVTSDGLILTVAHSFEDVANVIVEDATEDIIPATLIYLDLDRDLAILRLTESGSHPGLDLADHSQTETDNSDDGYDKTVRFIGFRDRGLRMMHDAEIVRYARVTLDGVGDRAGLELRTPIETGDSGGPVIDDNGDIIGLVFASSKALDSGWAIALEELETAINKAAEQQSALPLVCP